MEFSSETKGKLYSWVTEWRGASSLALKHRLSWQAGGRGCFIAIPSAGRGQSSHRLERGVLPWLQIAGRAQRLCTRPATAILNCSAALLHAVAELRWGHGRCTRGTQGWRAGCKASARGILWASEMRLSTKGKKRLDFILLSSFYFYFLGIVNGLCRWQQQSGTT